MISLLSIGIGRLTTAAAIQVGSSPKRLTLNTKYLVLKGKTLKLGA